MPAFRTGGACKIRDQVGQFRLFVSRCILSKIRGTDQKQLALSISVTMLYDTASR